MKFSIIIPVYNVKPYLEDCVNSVLMQSYTDWEAILVDDGSTDGSIASVAPLLSPHRGKIHVMRQENAGLSAARNAGLEVALGEYVLFLDSDDMLATADDLQRLADVVDTQDIVAFNNELWYPEENNRRELNKLFNHNVAQTFVRGLDYLHYFVEPRGWGPSAACFYAYRRAFIHAQQLRFPVGLLHEDELFVPLALSKAQTVTILPETLYVYRMRSSSIVHKPTHKHSQDKLTIAKQLYTTFQSIDTTPALKRIVYNLARAAANGLKRCSSSWWQAKCLMLYTAQNLRDIKHCILK